MVEAPTLTFSGTDPDWVASLQNQLDMLPATRRSAVMALHDAWAGKGPKTVEGIVRTNCFMRGVGCSDGVLCEEASRLNHSCSPNCEPSWDEQAGELQVRTSRDITPGEELSIFYIDVRATRAERAERLREFGFVCRCADCLTEHNDGDDRRQRLAELVRETGRRGEEEPQEALWMVCEALRLYDQEGIHVNTFRKQACFYAHQLCKRLGEAAAARLWIERASNYSERCHGLQHPETHRMRAALEALQDGKVP